MKRLYISIVLLLTVLAGGIASSLYIESADDDIQRLGEDIRQAAARGEDTSDEAAKLCQYWESYSRVLSCIENSSAITAITAEMSRLPALAADSSPDLVPQLDAVLAQCRTLSARQWPHLYSLL
ncbi:DUF4363 family protein [Ruminococcus sp.]|uniref:DUF4363 family protein n=1 Tax=Ruminococcus sp. TaxID=41978 RepID=UPI0025FFD0DE|nr:DUF4363 family protein [Ruminococcus sp.]MBQ8965468.1 DUF4363 family protein [Ruminococcus sp.]